MRITQQHCDNFLYFGRECGLGHIGRRRTAYFRIEERTPIGGLMLSFIHSPVSADVLLQHSNIGYLLRKLSGRK